MSLVATDGNNCHISFVRINSLLILQPLMWILLRIMSSPHFASGPHFVFTPTVVLSRKLMPYGLKTGQIIEINEHGLLWLEMPCRVSFLLPLLLMTAFSQIQDRILYFCNPWDVAEIGLEWSPTRSTPRLNLKWPKKPIHRIIWRKRNLTNWCCIKTDACQRQPRLRRNWKSLASWWPASFSWHLS